MFRSVVCELATRARVDTSRIERSRRPGRQLARHASGSRSLEQEDAIRLVADRCGYSRPRSSESFARGSGTVRTADAELSLCRSCEREHRRVEVERRPAARVRRGRSGGRSVTAAPYLRSVRQRRAPEVIIRPMLTVDRAIDLFLGDLTRRGATERTRRTYARLLDKFGDRLPDDYDVSKITTDDCRRWLDTFSGRARGGLTHWRSCVLLR